MGTESRVVAIVQARMGSTRLPGKVLADLAGRPLIAHVIERVQACAAVDHVVVAIPWTSENDRLADVLRALPVDVFRGAEHDVLDRYVQCARLYRAEIVVRVTGDCPLWAPEIGEETLTHLRPSRAYVRNLHWPGLDTEVMRIEDLEASALHATRSEDREHVFNWIARQDQAGLVSGLQFLPGGHAPWLAVDTLQDLERVCAVHAGLADPKDFSLDATLRGWERAGRP